MTSIKIAFIGLGAIGLPMARRLGNDPNVELTIFDVVPEVLVAEAHLGRVAQSIADALDGNDVVFSVLPADRHVRSVGAEIAAHGHAGQIYVDFSTISPSTMTEVAQAIELKGLTVLSGALMRSVAAAENGTLSIFLGGSVDAIEDIRPALELLATEIRVVESLGVAKALKIVNNMMVSALDLVICDGLLIAAKSGVSAAELVAELHRNGGTSWPLINHIEKHLLTNDLAPGRFSTRYMAKDAALAIVLASERSEPAWFAGMSVAAYRGTDSLGFGDHYHPIVMRWFEHIANLNDVISDVAAVNEILLAQGAEACRLIAEGIVAQQALISLEGLRIISGEAISVAEAVDHFHNGSSSNAFYTQLHAPRTAGGVEQNFGMLASAIARVCDLAQSATVPAFTFEVGRNIALALGRQHGVDLNVFDFARNSSSDARANGSART